MWKSGLLALACSLGGCIAMPTVSELKYDATDQPGMVAWVAVQPESLWLTLLPVDLTNGTFGKQITLYNWDGALVETPNSTIRQGGVGIYMSMHRLAPGDYAVMGFRTDNTQAGWRSQNSFCFAAKAQVLTIMPSEVAVWGAGNTTAYDLEVSRFRDATKNLAHFKPTAVTSATAMVDLTGGDPAAKAACDPKAVTVVQRFGRVASP
jgi:hypothetical protein